MTDWEYSLIELKDAANEACIAAIGKAEEIGGPVNWDDLECQVNWADLECHEAQRYFNDRGEIGYRILIEGASQDAIKLFAFIDRFLRKKGFAGIEIELNW